MYKQLAKHIWLALLFIPGLLVSCGDDIDAPATSNSQSTQPQVVKMALGVSKTGFTSADGGTRASSEDNSWKDGDVLFLRFHTDNDVVKGNAVYSAADREWTVSFYGALPTDKEQKVEVTYIEGAQATDDDVVHIYETQGIYQDLEGTYLYTSDKSLGVNASVKPMTGRIRFKGHSRENFTGVDVEYYEAYNKNDGNFQKTTYYNMTLLVDDDGYTPYYYFLPTEELKITHKQDDGNEYLYTMARPSNILAKGKSGWMNIPTTEKRNGWNSIKHVVGYENGHQWVDLGLPSGNKWAATDIGADSRLNKGDYTEFGGFGNYKTSTYYDGYDDIQGTSYDTAKREWQGEWVMPSKQDFDELKSYCHYVYDNTDSGYYIIGTSGVLIYMHVGKYWSSTPWTKTQYRGEAVVRKSWGLVLDNTKFSVQLIESRIIDHHATYDEILQQYWNNVRPIIKGK